MPLTLLLVDELQQRLAALSCCCFVPDCERVRVNGGAAPKGCKAVHVGTRRTACFRPASVFVPNPPRDPESAATRARVTERADREGVDRAAAAKRRV
jgi:hypothetical protein